MRFSISIALALSFGCSQADVSELEADNKELRAELRELREDVRSLRKDGREMAEKLALVVPAKAEAPAELPALAKDPAEGATAPLPESAPPPKQANVKIQIESNPRGATVFLGETILGKTPLLYQHAPGSEQLLLRIDKPGYRPRLMSIRPDEDAKISVQLARQ